MIYIIRSSGGDRVGSLSAEKDELKNLLDSSGNGKVFLVRGDEHTLYIKEQINTVQSAEVKDLEPSNAEQQLRDYFGIAKSTDIVAYVTSKLTKGGLPRKKPVTGSAE